ncbi:MAG: exosortase-associated EpsI family protein [Chloroflexota bacterium]
MSAESRRLAIVAGLLATTFLAIWIGPSLDRGPWSRSDVITSESRDTADAHFFLYIADTDGWGQSSDQSTVASRYDLRGAGILASFPMVIGRWRGADVSASETDLLGFTTQQHVFRQYIDDQGQLLWLRLLATNDWKLFYHTPAICYGESKTEPERSYGVRIGDGSLRLRGFVARLGNVNHLVLYTFLWSNRFRDMSVGATMVEVVAPFTSDRERAWRDAQEMVQLIFADNPSLSLSSSVSMQHTLGANLGDKVTLLGYDVSAATVRPGDALTVTLYWRPTDVMDEDYTVFLHVLNPPGVDAKERVLAQFDSLPFEGMFPTSRWKPGQVLKQALNLTIPAEAQPGEREVEVGMYLLSSGRRLGVVGSTRELVADSVMLQPICIGDPPS